MTETDNVAEEPIHLNAPTADAAVDERQRLAAWYASDEFARQLLATFEQARLAAIASNPPDMPG